MRLSPWQILVINDSAYARSPFLEKTDHGLLCSACFCQGDSVALLKKRNVQWNIDILDISRLLTYIGDRTINVCWDGNNIEPLFDICRELNDMQQKKLRLVISECDYDSFVNKYLHILFTITNCFFEIIILNEKDDQCILPERLQSRHLERRRPCRYPFDTISVGRSGKLYPCPYVYEKNFGEISQLEDIAKNKDYLLFLSAHLCGFLEDYPFCRDCQYWLDGWLGEEKAILQDDAGNRFDLLWEGHACTIKRSKRK